LRRAWYYIGKKLVDNKIIDITISEKIKEEAGLGLPQKIF